MKNIIFIRSQVESPIDTEHRFVCVGLNCWGMSETSAKEACKKCKVNAPHGAKYFITRVVHKSFQVDPVDGALLWDDSHDAAVCKLCTGVKAFGSKWNKTKQHH
jgi:hypothetical protein